jgi:murein L,D-transpeptidase YcbB/YkuD
MLVALIAGSVYADAHAPEGAGRFGQLMQAKIAAAQSSRRLICRGELVCGIAQIPRFYALRDYRPAWSDAAGGPSESAEELIRHIESTPEDGLEPHSYHMLAVQDLVQMIKGERAAGREPDPAWVVDMDFLLTDAFLLIASHLRAGRVNPHALTAEWVVALGPETDIVRVLTDAVESARVGEAMDVFRPPHTQYRVLKAALKRYRNLMASGEWPRLPEKATWDRGQSGEIADRLRERLVHSGDMVRSAMDDDDADAELFEGLRRFQTRHGLEADGRLGPQTLRALNVSLRDRTRQIELNLERWRWLPHDLGERYILVNVPRFELAVFEDEQATMTMRVVVGRHYRRTPVFSSLMDHIVINPDWNIPRRIAVEDILPKVHKDPNYLSREKIRVFESWGRDAAILDPHGIDWGQVTPENFHYKLKKDPGPGNDLGRIKFMFPNPFDVYLHDTPSKRLFERSMRGFSSGCIRIEKPIELAEYVLKESPGWSREAVSNAINAGHPRTVSLSRKIPVHLIYMTAAVDPEGALRFFPDIYERDPALDRALRERSPRIP